MLLLHGLLHLQGFDHERGEDESAAMEAEERRILSTLGWQASLQTLEALLKLPFVGTRTAHPCAVKMLHQVIKVYPEDRDLTSVLGVRKGGKEY